MGCRAGPCPQHRTGQSTPEAHRTAGGAAVEAMNSDLNMTMSLGRTLWKPITKKKGWVPEAASVDRLASFCTA